MKKNISLLIFISALLSIITALKGAENPVNADIVVALDGSGDFTSLQAAINAVPSNSDRRTVIYLKRGLYNTEKLLVPGVHLKLFHLNTHNIRILICYRQQSV